MILGGAVGVVLRSHPVHAALSLILTLFGVAVLFVAQDAHFLAAVQVIVYAGAIVVLFLFVIMLLGVDKAEDLRDRAVQAAAPAGRRRRRRGHRPVVFAAISSRDTIGLVEPPQAIRRTGRPGATRQQHPQARRATCSPTTCLAFELTSVLLVIAVVGTVLLARRAPEVHASGTSRRDMSRAPHRSRRPRGTSCSPPCCSASARSGCWSGATRWSCSCASS